MSLYIGVVIERAIHFETVIVLGSEIPDVLQYHAYAVGARFAPTRLNSSATLRRVSSSGRG